MVDAPIGIIESVTQNRPEIVFLPPVLLGYIAYLQQDLFLFILTILVIVISVGMHDIAEAIKKEGQYKATNLQERTNAVSRTFVFNTIILFPFTSFAILLYAIVVFYQTFNLYVGIGISLYVVWIVKILSPVKKLQDN
jgi:heme O synthase-like polyprenyltransferase